MADLLDNLAARALGRARPLLPRPAPRFEPAPADEWGEVSLELDATTPARAKGAVSPAPGVMGAGHGLSTAGHPTPPAPSWVASGQGAPVAGRPEWAPGEPGPGRALPEPGPGARAATAATPLAHAPAQATSGAPPASRPAPPPAPATPGHAAAAQPDPPAEEAQPALEIAAPAAKHAAGHRPVSGERGAPAPDPFDPAAAARAVAPYEGTPALLDPAAAARGLSDDTRGLLSSPPDARAVEPPGGLPGLPGQPMDVHATSAAAGPGQAGATLAGERDARAGAIPTLHPPTDDLWPEELLESEAFAVSGPSALDAAPARQGQWAASDHQAGAASEAAGATRAGGSAAHRVARLGTGPIAPGEPPLADSHGAWGRIAASRDGAPEAWPVVDEDGATPLIAGRRTPVQPRGSGQPAVAPVISVTIGRVEVRAARPAAPAAPQRPAAGTASLDDYLRERRGR